MGLVKAVQHQVGLSSTISQNFTVTAEDADGTLKIKRGTVGNYVSTPFAIDPDDHLKGSVTPPQFDSSFSLATTEFVQRALGNHSNSVTLSPPVTLTPSHAGNALIMSGSGTITLPLVTSMPPGTTLVIIAGNNFTGSVVCSGSDVIVAGFSGTITSISLAQSDYISLVSDGVSTAWRVISGSSFLKYVPEFASSLVVNGYQRLPSGLIIQWGTVNTSATGDNPTTFPIPFPSLCFGVLGSATETIGTAPRRLASFSNGTSELTGFRCRVFDEGTSVAVASIIRWHSLGF